jgi:hypothetical protein
MTCSIPAINDNPPYSLAERRAPQHVTVNDVLKHPTPGDAKLFARIAETHGNTWKAADVFVGRLIAQGRFEDDFERARR